ncbi:hypothetical protein [Shimia aestuarii]|uniref:CopC domain-containing protein n=1 Tax=Shimia aestuarii TaxID=254406 RepID=A0A1I4N873_9RHOB|nr:hypothetical protein [Shimia aestuarii]SFM11595.1 hypothetical protein SAMN04488042_10434 [Shimia aestuarii]
MKFLATILSGALLTAGAAGAQEFNCTFPKQGVNSWIRGQIIVKFDPATQTASVFDSLINQEFGAPIAAKVSTNNDKRLTVRWRLRNVQTRLGFAPSIDYTLSYLKQTGQANANAIAPLVDEPTRSPFSPGQYSAGGSCAPR